MTGPEAPTSFRLVYVPGVTPAKWVRIWIERLPAIRLELIPATWAEAAETLRGGGADAGLVRLPVDRTELSAIPLYSETSVVVVPKDHELTAAEELTVEDLAEYIVLHPLDDCLEWERLPGVPAKQRPETTGGAIELVAAGIGLLVVPKSLARLHHRKDLTYRPIADVPESHVALSWPEARTTDLVEEFIGIVRGRTVNSSRGRAAPEPTAAPAGRKRPESGTAGSDARQRSASSRAPARPGPGGSGGKSAKAAKGRRRG